jgi:hypothetical protein
MKEEKYKDLPPINKRIRLLVDEMTNGSVADFVELIKVKSHQNLNRIFNVDKRNGKYPEPSAEILNCIKVNLPQINYDWLITGKGDRIKEKIQPGVMMVIETAESVTIPKSVLAVLEAQAKAIESQQQTIRSQQMSIRRFMPLCENLSLSGRQGIAGDVKTARAGG